MLPTVQNAFEQGLESFAKHCLRYGTIVQDDSGEFIKGHWRRYVIAIQGEQAFIVKENGVTTGAMILPH